VSVAPSKPLRALASLGLIVGLIVGLIGCGAPELALTRDHLVQSGAELQLVGDVGGHGAVIVIVDGVPAHSAVIEGHRLRVSVPPLPRTGAVDVELLFADGASMSLSGALTVSAPRLTVASNSGEFDSK
jgi:hypothetical protein